MELSIVTGTYNRLPHLQKMVESVRSSIGRGITYEIVLVDGGSSDGTIDWCNAQNDVVLIEQKELLGAVKAFNAGFKVARGRYVVIGNDDIVFVDDSLVCALVFMHENPGIGVGCFWQDRDIKRFHVESMQVIKDGKTVSLPYGQVCIVPKWLGDEVGWWGNYLHTYGGDNELSANVYELGYDIQAVPCACIHDLKVEDGLREMNGGDPRELAGRHPDSIKFYEKWKKGIHVGNPKEDVHKLTKRARVFYMPIYEAGWDIQRTTRTGLLDALQKVTTVYEYDYLNQSLDRMLDLAYRFNPHTFLIQAQDANRISAPLIRMMRREHPDAKFYLWNGDYHPDNLYSSAYMDLCRAFHLCGFATADIKERYDKVGIQWMYQQIGIEKGWSDPSKDDEHYDVVFLANGYSEKRIKLARYLKSLSDIKVGLFGSWPDDFGAIRNTTYDFAEGVKIMRSAKFVISDQQWPDATGYVSNRLFQSLYAGGGVVLQQNFDKMEELLGFVNGVHLLVWNDFADIRTLIDEYIDDDKTRKKIAVAGKDRVEKRFTWEEFIRRMFNKLYDLKFD